MDRGRSVERVRQEIIRLSHAGLDSRTFRAEAVKQLRKAIPVDVSFFATADPATLLFTSVVVDDVLARATGEFLENEFLRDDSVKFTSLARAPRRSVVWVWRRGASWSAAHATRRFSSRWSWGTS